MFTVESEEASVYISVVLVGWAITYGITFFVLVLAHGSEEWVGRLGSVSSLSGRRRTS